MESALNVLEVALIVVVFLWVGKRPTVPKVGASIVAIWLVEYGGLVALASGQGLSVHDYCTQALTASLDALGNSLSASDQTAVRFAFGTLVGCIPGVYAISASARVFAVLCIRWMCDRVRRKTQWTAFSQVDLSVWWVIPLMAGIVLYIVSVLPGMTAHRQVFLLAMNVFMVSAIPLFVQGAAVGKDIMNRRGVQLAWQLVLGFFMLASGVAFLVLPLLGLVDFWANFRKLPRDGQDQGKGSGQDQRQRRLPD